MLFFRLKVSKDMHQSIVPILFSLLESHASGAEFMRPNQKWKEMCSMRGNLMADRRRRKGQTVRTTGGAICRDFRQHDEVERTKVGARTRYLNMPEVKRADRMCSGYRKSVLLQATPGWRLPQDHQAAHLTRGKAHSVSPGRTARKPGLLNNM